MAVIDNTFKPENFVEFLDKHGVDIEIKERGRYKEHKLLRYYASPKGLEYTDGAILTHTHGNGDTPELAIQDLARQLAGRRLVIHAWSPEREEFQAPNEWA